MKLLILIPIILTATTLLAEDIKTLSGTTYQNITVTRVEANGISISHDDGLAKIPFTDLSEELRSKYNYDPKKAAQLSQVEQAAAAQRAAKANEEAVALAAAKSIAAKVKKRCVLVAQVVGDGILADASPGDWTGGQPLKAAFRERIFVQGVKGVAESYCLIIAAYPDGTHTYTDTAGASRTIEKWVFVPGTAKRITTFD